VVVVVVDRGGEEVVVDRGGEGRRKKRNGKMGVVEFCFCSSSYLLVESKERRKPGPQGAQTMFHTKREEGA